MLEGAAAQVDDVSSALDRPRSASARSDEGGEWRVRIDDDEVLAPVQPREARVCARCCSGPRSPRAWCSCSKRSRCSSGSAWCSGPTRSWLGNRRRCSIRCRSCSFLSGMPATAVFVALQVDRRRRRGARRRAPVPARGVRGCVGVLPRARRAPRQPRQGVAQRPAVALVGGAARLRARAAPRRRRRAGAASRCGVGPSGPR